MARTSISTLSAIVIFLSNYCFALTFVDINNFHWTISNSNSSIVAPAIVPGGVYSALMKAGFLRDGAFYYRFNDAKYRYISYENWTFETNFSFPAALFSESRVNMEFDGLDTIAEIYLDGNKVGGSDNSFTRYSFDIKHLMVKNYDHKLKMSFTSPVLWAKNAFNEQALDYVVPPKCVPRSYNGECHANHIRKMQSSFSWDFAPAFPDSGIWKPWRIYGWKSLIIDKVLFTCEALQSLPTFPSPDTSPNWKVTLKIYMKPAIIPKSYKGRLQMELNKWKYIDTNITIFTSEFDYSYTVTFNVKKDTFKLWWPNGYGARQLYLLKVTWISEDTSELSSKEIEVGFRTVELDQSLLDSKNVELGRHFRFRVNNVTMFMKGSNWVPAHILQDQLDPKYVEQLLQDAADTHQNILRVWGGGVYETDAFYSIADKLGILIWQDFMFACSMYPSKDWFLNTVQEEIKTQVRRLQHHASILLWAGNNENEAALRGNWYDTKLNFTLYKSDYISLYVNTIRNITKHEDISHRPFIVSSPGNGIESEREGYIAKNPYDGRYGDVHFYNYLADGWNYKTFPHLRFSSEYGYQSWPSFTSIRKVSSPEDWRVESSFMEHRQHLPFGNKYLLLQIISHFEFPANVSGCPLNHYLYLTQVHQAMAIKTETETYRRAMSEADPKGRGFTSGALYWQLNNPWIGPSWSSIEFGGTWKMLHYFANKFYSPLLLSPWIHKNQVVVTTVNDNYYDINNATLTVYVRPYLGTGAIKIYKSGALQVTSHSSETIARYDLAKDLNLPDVCHHPVYSPEEICFLTFSLTNQNASNLCPDAFLLLTKPKNASLMRANVSISHIKQEASRRYRIELTTDHVALFVWLEVGFKGVFSDNGFLMTDSKVSLTFNARESVPSIIRLKENMTVISLSDTMQFIL